MVERDFLNVWMCGKEVSGLGVVAYSWYECTVLVDLERRYQGRVDALGKVYAA